MSSSKEIIIGIDLGTTHSCVSSIRNGNVEIVPDRNNEAKVIPSIVCFKSLNECLIGVLAKNNMTQYFKSTMFIVKDFLVLNLKIKKFKKILKDGLLKLLKIVKQKNHNILLM